MKFHKSLTLKTWEQKNLAKQMANIGMEVERAIAWKKKGNQEYSKLAFYRCLELLDLTIADKKNRIRLIELVKLREVLVDYFIYDNLYNFSEESWSKYFYPFLYAARKDT